MSKRVSNKDQPDDSPSNLIANAPNKGMKTADSTPLQGHRQNTIGIHYKAPTEIVDFTVSNSYICIATKNTVTLLSAASSVLISQQSFKITIARIRAAANDACLYIITNDGVLYILQAFGRPYNIPSVRAIDLVHSADSGSCIDLAIANRTNAYAPVVQFDRTVSDVHMEIDPSNYQNFIVSFHVKFSAALNIPSFNVLSYCNNFSHITSYHLRNRVTAVCFGNFGLSFIGDITGRIYIMMTSDTLRNQVQNQNIPVQPDTAPRIKSKLVNFIFFGHIYPESIKQIHLLSPVTLFLGYIDGMMLTINLKTKMVIKHDIACTNTYQSGRLKTKITGKPGIRARVLFGSDPLLGKFCISKHKEAQRKALRSEELPEATRPPDISNAEPNMSSQTPVRDFLTEYIELKEKLAKENAEGMMQELLDTFVEEWEHGPTQYQVRQPGSGISTQKQATPLTLPRPSVILTKGFESSQIASIDEYLVLFTCFKGYLAAFNLTAYDNAISKPIFLENLAISHLYNCDASEKYKKTMQLRIHRGRLLVAMANMIHSISLPQFLLPLVNYIPRFGNYRFYSQGECDILGNSEEDYPYDVRVIFESADISQQSLFMKGCNDLDKTALNPDPVIDLSVKTAISAYATDQFMDSNLYKECETPTNRSGSTGQGAGALSKSDPRSPVQLLKHLRDKRMRNSPNGRSLSTPRSDGGEPQFRMVLSDKIALAEAHLQVARESLIREKMLEQIMKRFEYGQDNPNNYHQLSPRQGSYDRYKKISENMVDRYDHTRFLPVTNLSGEIIKGRHRHVHSLNFEKDYYKVIDDKMKKSSDGLLHNNIRIISQERLHNERINVDNSVHSDASLALSDLITESDENLSQSPSTLASISGDSFETPCTQKEKDNRTYIFTHDDILRRQDENTLGCDSQHAAMCDNSMRPIVDLTGQSFPHGVDGEQNNLLLTDLELALSNNPLDRQAEQLISKVINHAMLYPEQSDSSKAEDKQIENIVSFILSTQKYSDGSYSESPTLRSRVACPKNSGKVPLTSMQHVSTPQEDVSTTFTQGAWPRIKRVSELYSISKLLLHNKEYASMASAMIHILKLPRQDTTDKRIATLLSINRKEDLFKALAQTSLFTDNERTILNETLDDAKFYYQQLGFPAIDINKIKPSTFEGVSQWKGYVDSHGIVPHKLTDLKSDLHFKHPERNLTSALSAQRVPKLHKVGKEPSMGTPETRKQEHQGSSKYQPQLAKKLNGLQVFALQPATSTPGSSSLRKSLSLSVGATTVMTAPPSSAPHSLSAARTSTVFSSKSRDFVFNTKSSSSPIAKETHSLASARVQENLPVDISIAVAGYSEDRYSQLEQGQISISPSQNRCKENLQSSSALQKHVQSNIAGDSRRESRPTNSRDSSMDSSISDNNDEYSDSIEDTIPDENRVFKSSPKSSGLFDSSFLRNKLKASKSDPQTLRPKLRPPDILYPIAPHADTEGHKLLSVSTNSVLQSVPQTVHQRPARPSSLPSSSMNQRKSVKEVVLQRETHHAWLKSRARAKNTVRVTVFTGIPKYYDTRTRIEYAHKHQFNMLQQRDLTDSVEPVGNLVYKVARPSSMPGLGHTTVPNDLTYLSVPQTPLEVERHGSNLLTDDGSFMSTNQPDKADMIYRPAWSASEATRKTLKIHSDTSVLSAIEFYPQQHSDNNDLRNGPILVNLNQQLTHIMDTLATRMYGEKEKRFLARYTESVTGALVQQARLANAQGNGLSPDNFDDRRSATLDRRPSTGTPMHQGVLLDKGMPLSSLAKLSSALGNIVYRLTVMRQATCRQTTEEEAIEARNEMWNAAVTEINKAFPNMLHVSSGKDITQAPFSEKIKVNINNNKNILYTQSTDRPISPVKEKIFREPQRLTWKIGAANAASVISTRDYRYIYDTEARTANDADEHVDRPRHKHSHIAIDGVQSAKYMRSVAEARRRFAPYSLKDVLQVFSYLDVGVGANGEIRSLNADRLTKIYHVDSDIYGCADKEETSDGEFYQRAGSGARYPSLETQQEKDSLEARRSSSFQYFLSKDSAGSLSEILSRHESQNDLVIAKPTSPINTQEKNTRDHKGKRTLKHPLLEDESLVQSILADFDILPTQYTFDSQNDNTAIQIKRKDLTRLLLCLMNEKSQDKETKVLEPLLPQVVKNDYVFKEQLASFLHEKRGLVEQHSIRVSDLIQTQKRFEDTQEQTISLQTVQRSTDGVIYDSKVSLLNSTGKSVCEQLRDSNQPLEISTLDLVNMNVTKYRDKPSNLLHSAVFSPMKFHTMRAHAFAAKKRIHEKQSSDTPELILPSVFIENPTDNLPKKVSVNQEPVKDELSKTNLYSSQVSLSCVIQGDSKLSSLNNNLTLSANLHKSLVSVHINSDKNLQDRNRYASDSGVNLLDSANVKSLQPNELILASSLKSSKVLADLTAQQYKDVHPQLRRLDNTVKFALNENTQQYSNDIKSTTGFSKPARIDMVANTKILDGSPSIHQTQSSTTKASRKRKDASEYQHADNHSDFLSTKASNTQFDSAPEVGLTDIDDVSTQSGLKSNQDLVHSLTTGSPSTMPFPSDTFTSQSNDSLTGSTSGKSKGHGSTIQATSTLGQDSIHSGLPPRPSSGTLRPTTISPRLGRFSSIHDHIKSLKHPSNVTDINPRDKTLLLSMLYRSPYNLRRPDTVLSAMEIKIANKMDTPQRNTGEKKQNSLFISHASNISSASSSRKGSKSSSFSCSRSSSPTKWSDDSDVFVGAVIAQMCSPRASAKKFHYKKYKYGTLTPREGFSTHPGRSRSCCDLLRRTRDGYLPAIQACFLDFQSHCHTKTDPRLSADVFFSHQQPIQTEICTTEQSGPEITSEQMRSFSRPVLPLISVFTGSAITPHIASQLPSENSYTNTLVTTQPYRSTLYKKDNQQKLPSINLGQTYQRYINTKHDSFKKDSAIFKSQQLIVLSEHMTSLSNYLYPLTQTILYASYHDMIVFSTYTEIEMQSVGLKKHRSYFYYNMPQWASKSFATQSATDICPENQSKQRLDCIHFMDFLRNIFTKASNDKSLPNIDNKETNTHMYTADITSNCSTTDPIIDVSTDMVYPEGKRRMISYANCDLANIPTDDYDREIMNSQNLPYGVATMLLIPPRSKSARQLLINRQYIRQRPNSIYNISNSRDQSMNFHTSRSSSPSYHSDIHRSFSIVSGKSCDITQRSFSDQISSISTNHSKTKRTESELRRARSFEELRRLERYSHLFISKDRLYDDCNMYYIINHWKYSLSKHCCIHRPLPSKVLFGKRWDDSQGAVIPSAETRDIIQRRIRSRIQCSKIFKSTEHILQENYKRFYPDTSYYTLGSYNIRQYSPISSHIPHIPSVPSLLQKRRVGDSFLARDFLETSISDEEFVFNGVYTHNHVVADECCYFAFETSLITASQMVQKMESCFNKKLIIDTAEIDIPAITRRSGYKIVQNKGFIGSTSPYQSIFSYIDSKEPQTSSEIPDIHINIPTSRIHNHGEHTHESKNEENTDSVESPIHRLSVKLYAVQQYLQYLNSMKFSSTQLTSVALPNGIKFSNIDCISGPIEASFLNNINSQYWGLIKSWNQAYSNVANVLTSATSAYVMIAENTQDIMLLALNREENTDDDPETFLKNLLKCRYDTYKYNKLRSQEEQLYEVCPDTLPDLSRIGRRKRNKIMSRYDIFGKTVVSKGETKRKGIPEKWRKTTTTIPSESTEISQICDQKNASDSKSSITPISFSEKNTYKSLLGPGTGDRCLLENKEIGWDIGSNSTRLATPTHVFTVDIQRTLCRSVSRERTISTPSRRKDKYNAQELTREIVLTRGTYSLAGHISTTSNVENTRSSLISRRRPISARAEDQLSSIKTRINKFARSQALCHRRQLPIYLMEIIILQASENLSCSLPHIFRHRESAVYYKNVVEKEFAPTISRQTVLLNDLPPCTGSSGFAHVVYGSENVLDTYSLINRRTDVGSIYAASRLKKFLMLPVDYIDYRTFLLHTKELNKHVKDVSMVLQSQKVMKSLETRDAQLSQLMKNTRIYSDEMAPCYELWNRLVFNAHHVLGVQSIRIYSEQFERLLKQHNGDLDLIIEKALTLNSDYYAKHPNVFSEYQIRKRQKDISHKAELDRIRCLMIEVMRGWRLHGPVYNLSGLLLINYRETTAFKEALQRYFPVVNEEMQLASNPEPVLNSVPFGTGEIPITARERSKEGDLSEKSDKALLLSNRSTRPTTGTSCYSNSNRFVPNIISEKELDAQYRMRHLLLSRLVMIEFSTRLFEAQCKNNILTAIQYMVPDELNSIFSQLPPLTKSQPGDLFKRISAQAFTSGKSKIGVYDYMYGVSFDEMETKEIVKTRKSLEKDNDLREDRFTIAKDATVTLSKELSRPSTALPVNDIKLTMIRDSTPSPLVSSPTKAVALALKMNNLDMLARDIKQRLDRIQKGDLNNLDDSVVDFMSQSESFFSICDPPGVQTKLEDLQEEQSSIIEQEPSGSETVNKKGRRVTISDDSHAPSAPQAPSSSSRPMSGSQFKPLSTTKSPLNVVQLNMSLNVKQKAARLTVDSLRSRGMKAPSQDKDLGRILHKLITTDNSDPRCISSSSDNTLARTESSTSSKPSSATRQPKENIGVDDKKTERKKFNIIDATPVTRNFSATSTTEKKTTSQNSRLSSIRSAGIQLPRHIEKTLEAGVVSDMTPNYYSLNSSLQASFSPQEDSENLNNLFTKYANSANVTNAKDIPVHRCQSSIDRGRTHTINKCANKLKEISMAEYEYKKAITEHRAPMALKGVSVQRSIQPEVLLKAKRQVDLLPRSSVNNSADQSICSADYTPSTMVRPSSSFETGYAKDVNNRNPWKKGSLVVPNVTPQPKYLSQSHVKDLITSTSSLEQSLNMDLTENELAHIEALGRRRLKPENGSTWTTIGGIARPGSSIGMRTYLSRKRSDD